MDLARVHKVLNILKAYGIDYVDPKPWNIRFRREVDEIEDEPEDDRFDLGDESD